MNEAVVQWDGERGDREVDLQVSTARRYPREVSDFKAALLTNVTRDEESAEACIFALPRQDKTVEGASIRFAELAIAAWGNNRVRGRIIDAGRIDLDHVTVEGAFWDLESNSIVSKEVKRRITTKDGRRYGADMIMQTVNAAISIAIRNAALAGIPRTIWEPIYQEARKVVAGDAQTMANRRAKAIEYLAKFGVREDMILATLKKKSLDDLDADDIVVLRASARAIRDGEATIEESFVDPKKADAAVAAKKGVDGLKAALQTSGEGGEAQEGGAAAIVPPAVQEGAGA